MSKIKYVGETALNALIEKIKSITGTVTGVMRFIGSLKELPKDNTSYNKGDVILVGTKEYVLNETDGNKVWVEIGDEGLWLSKNAIEQIRRPKPQQVTDNTNSLYVFSVNGEAINLDVDFSKMASKDFVNNLITSFDNTIDNRLKNFIEKTVPLEFNTTYKFNSTDKQSITLPILQIGAIESKATIDISDVYNQINSIKTNNVKLDFFEQIFEFTDSKRSINQKYLIEGARTVTTLIDLSDVYSKIDFIKTNYLKIDNFNNVIYNLENKMKGHFTKSSNITSDGHIPLSLTDNTPIAHTDDIKKDIVLDTKKFVEDLKTEFINTGFVHDDSNTKTTFEEITYEEVENLFK